MPAPPDADRRLTAPALRVHESTRDHVFGWAEPVLFYSWRGVTTLESLVRGERYFDLAAAARPDGRFALFGSVEPAATAPGSELRQRLGAMMRKHAPVMVASAFIVEGNGFKAAAMRSVATGMSMIVREPFPHRIFSTVGAAADWVTGMLDAGGITTRGAGELATTFDRIRAAAPT